MSDIGSGGPRGSPPIGTGPRRVDNAFRPGEDKKRVQERKEKKRDGRGNKKDSERQAFSVKVDTGHFHLKAGETLEGLVSTYENEHRFVFANGDGVFAAEGNFISSDIKPKADQSISVLIDDVEPAIKGRLVLVQGMPVPKPLPVILSIRELDYDHLAAKAYAQAAIPGSKTGYTGASPGPKQEADDPSVLLTKAGATDNPPSATPGESVNTPNTSQATSGPKSSLSPQDLASFIALNEIDEQTDASENEARINSVHNDHWPTIDRLMRQYHTAFPDTAEEVEKGLRGTLKNVPDGLSLFVAGLIFASPEAWFGRLLSENLAESPALAALKRDFFELRTTLLSPHDENWRLFLVSHPEEALDKKLEIIGHVRVIETEEGSIALRHIASRQHYETIGPVQIEAILGPASIQIVFHLSEAAPDDEQVSIKRLLETFFARAHIQGSVRFEPISNSDLDYSEIVKALKSGEPSRPVLR